MSRFSCVIQEGQRPNLALLRARVFGIRTRTSQRAGGEGGSWFYGSIGPAACRPTTPTTSTVEASTVAPRHVDLRPLAVDSLESPQGGGLGGRRHVHRGQAEQLVGDRMCDRSHHHPSERYDDVEDRHNPSIARSARHLGGATSGFGPQVLSDRMHRCTRCCVVSRLGTFLERPRPSPLDVGGQLDNAQWETNAPFYHAHVRARWSARFGNLGRLELSRNLRLRLAGLERRRRGALWCHRRPTLVRARDDHRGFRIAARGPERPDLEHDPGRPHRRTEGRNEGAALRPSGPAGPVSTPFCRQRCVPGPCDATCRATCSSKGVSHAWADLARHRSVVHDGGRCAAARTGFGLIFMRKRQHFNAGYHRSLFWKAAVMSVLTSGFRRSDLNVRCSHHTWGRW